MNRVAVGVGTVAGNVWLVTAYELCDHEQLIWYFLCLFFLNRQIEVILVPS